MAIIPKGTGAKLGGGKLPAKAYSEYTRPSRTSDNYSSDVRSDAKARHSPINLSILFGKDDEEDEDNMKAIRKAAIKRKLKKVKRSK